MTSCPRDRAPLEIVHRADGKIEIDVCRQCGGVWLDSHELAALCPTAAHLPERRDEAVLGALARSRSGALSETMPGCPRCKGVPFEIVLAGAAIDFCASCGGVWVDGEEVAAIVSEPAEERKATMPGGSPFRRAAAELAAEGKAICAACSARVTDGELYARRDGFVCLRCWAKDHQASAEARAKEGALVHALASALTGLIRAFSRGRSTSA